MGCGKSKTQQREEQLNVVTNFTPEELRSVYDDFMKTTPSGQMTRDQFEKYYKKLTKKSESKLFIDHLFRTFDFNRDGKMNFKEFVCGISVTTRGTFEEKLTWTFNVYDVNQDGSITYDELTEILRAIYAINGTADADVMGLGCEAFKGLDTNNDGRITVAEFVRGAKQDQRLFDMLNKTSPEEQS